MSRELCALIPTMVARCMELEVLEIYLIHLNGLQTPETRQSRNG